MGRAFLLLPAVLLLAAGCTPAVPPPAGAPQPARAAPTAAEAAAFVDSAEALLYELGVRSSRAAWVQATNITHDTDLLAAEANRQLLAARTPLAKQAARYSELELPYDVDRKLMLLRLALSMPSPSDADKTAELSRTASGLRSAYGRGKYCPPGGGECLDVEALSEIMANSRDPQKLREAWTGWRTIAPPMRDDYRRFVELMNEGARELGFPDVGAMWRSQYDMPPDAFAAELDRLWEQVRPLYDALHCHVRARLADHYGSEVVPPGEPIPAHLLGNMWAQEWGNVYPLVAPPRVEAAYDLTERLKAKGYTPLRMVRQAEGFFTSLGFDTLPATFWDRSLFTKPRDREVVCHASAWNIDDRDDLRIKMCIDVNAEDFQTIHHELGHNFYQRAYAVQPPLYRGSANDGFHEALGDVVALSVTPAYLKQIGLVDREPGPSQDIDLLLRDALDKVAFLPFGLLVDQWRWKVFSGEISPEEYNRGWWELREKYQGVRAPVERTEAEFDPGAKYHVPANTPYARYFLARILQYQFQRALCREAGFEGPLHRCSIYGNREAGERLQAMMQMGKSRPWPEALEALTGEPRMDATALLDYFAPLKAWLDQQNQSRQCGWTAGTTAFTWGGPAPGGR
ncbi:MAG TPA: M2 family metallopeptidase [Longimicrobiaceae bacterium]|nr:M2 family metallopeptidase [Longimicrobiaceae bacterium]